MNNKPMKILIIEDDVYACKEFIENIKRRKDIELVGLTDSDIEAKKIVKLKKPEGIILDLELNNSLTGNIDSFEFLSSLKNMEINYSPIIIVTTHVNSKRTYEILHREGVDLILYKEHHSYSSELVLNKFINLRSITPNKSIEEIKEENNGIEERISNYINEELELIGIPSKLIGRKYLHDAIFYLIKYEESNKSVFNYLTKIYRKSETTINNGMNNAIIHAWRESPIEDLLKYYTARVSPEKGIPTSGEFMYYYKDKIKRKI